MDEYEAGPSVPVEDVLVADRVPCRYMSAGDGGGRHDTLEWREGECCNHCRAPPKDPTNTPMVIPLDIDDSGVVHLDQYRYCSPQCVMAASKYFLGSDAQRAQRVVAMATWLSRVGINTREVAAAPPVGALKAYGGSLTLEEFREDFTYVSCTELTHTFVTHQVIVQLDEMK